MISKLEVMKRIRFMLVEAIIFLVLLLALGYPWAALGLVVGAGAGIFNYWLVSKVIVNPVQSSEAIKQNRFMKRYLLRLLVAGVVMITTALIDTGLLMGALLGLTLEMQTYLWEALKQIWGKPL